MTDYGDRWGLKTIVLAGGLSRRMGQDKARIEILGIPLLTKICTLGLAISDFVMVVAGVDRDYSDILPRSCIRIVDLVLDGPLVALANAMEMMTPQPPSLGGQECGDDGDYDYDYDYDYENHWEPNHETDWVLVLACDLPNLSVAVVQAWVGQLDALPGETIAYLPKSEQGWEPLCGFYRLRTIESVQRFVKSGGRSFQRWLDQSSVRPFVRELEWEDRSVFLNCNTPIDLAAIEAVIEPTIEPTIESTIASTIAASES